MKNEKHLIYIAPVETVLGTMVAAATDEGICMLQFADSKLLQLELRQLQLHAKTPLVEGEHPLFGELREQLDDYFAGRRWEFDLPLCLVGTEFQKSVWLSLLQIPYGSTTSYGCQAKQLGRDSSVRAVANANGKNKISILLPCHRVVGADGTPTGYAGGIERKQWLLKLEKSRTETTR